MDKTTLTFTTTTWETAQTVTVTAVEDELSEGDESFTVTHTVTSAADSNYDGTTAGSVAVTVKDAPGVAISETALIVQEGNTGTYTVVLNTEPAGDVTVTISGHAGPDVSVDKTTLTFTTTTWSAAQTVTVTATDDATNEGSETFTLTHTVASTDDTVYGGITSPDLDVEVTDNDTPGVTISETALIVQEGNTGTYTVVLNTEPAGDVTVTISGHAGPDVSVDKTTLTFTATTWETAQTVTVTAVDDEIDGDGETVTLTHTVASAADSDYQGISAGSVAVSITDDDLPSVNVSFEQSTYTVQEGNSTRVKVKLNQSQGGRRPGTEDYQPDKGHHRGDRRPAHHHLRDAAQARGPG